VIFAYNFTRRKYSPKLHISTSMGTPLIPVAMVKMKWLILPQVLANWFFSLCLFGYVLKKVLALECSLEDKGLQPNQMAVLAVRTYHLALSKLHLIFNFIC
jgi:hypothetical protein